MSKKYNSAGIVLGKLWGGGIGGYKATDIEAKTRAELIKKAKKMLDDGSLDDGMGFEYLRGALLTIRETETIEHNGKEYHRVEPEYMIIGKITSAEKQQLYDWYDNY
jgi:hypothetical protein